MACILLWSSAVRVRDSQAHRRRMWQGSASVVSWNWEKYPCHSKLVSTLSMQPLSVSGEYLRLGTLISYNWEQGLEACECLKRLFHLLWSLWSRTEHNSSVRHNRYLFSRAFAYTKILLVENVSSYIRTFLFLWGNIHTAAWVVKNPFNWCP